MYSFIKQSATKMTIRAIWLLRVMVVLLLATAGASAFALTLAGTQIVNVASATYIPSGLTATETVSSNRVFAIVASVEALTLLQSQTVTRPPGSSLTLSHLLTNTGNTASNYTLSLVNLTAAAGGTCSADNADLASLSLAIDMNSNGVFDAGDTVLPLNGAGVTATGAIHLAPGASISLLVQGKVPNGINLLACVGLTATTAASGISANNTDAVSISNSGVLLLTKSVNQSFAMPGAALQYTINGNNVGVQPVAPGVTLVGGGTFSAPACLATGTPVILLRDLIPTNTNFVPGSLTSSGLLGRYRLLYRIASDPAFQYRCMGGADAGNPLAVEVAVALLDPIATSTATQMSFSAMVQSGILGTVQNNAQTYYNNGAANVMDNSNTVLLSTPTGRLGIAKAATSVTPNGDGSNTAQFALRVKNYGTDWVYNVQLNDALSNAASGQFGTYTSAAAPGPGQYTVVSGSLSVTGPGGGNVPVVDTSFTGDTSHGTLLVPGDALGGSEELTVRFQVRYNATGRTDTSCTINGQVMANTLCNSATAQGSLTPAGAGAVSAQSVNGANPDPSGTGYPTLQEASPTPVSALSSTLILTKTLAPPVALGGGQFALTYTFNLTNSGTTPATYVRLYDNLSCTFGAFTQPAGSIQSWSVTATQVNSGPLRINPSYTGVSPCSATSVSNILANPAGTLPGSVTTQLNDGTVALAPGQSANISITVQVQEAANAIGTPVTFTNVASGASYVSNVLSNPAITGATATSVAGLLADPSGTVYVSTTGQPVAGATVTVTRTACNNGPATPILPSEIFNGTTPGLYTFNANGSMSMQTNALGQYQFYLQSPPAAQTLCRYTLLVTPPGGLVFPSVLRPPGSGYNQSAGDIIASATPPGPSAAVWTYFLTLNAGFGVGGAPYEVFDNHIPLDPAGVGGLVLQKVANKGEAEVGDFIDFALKLSNLGTAPLSALSFTDQLPPGMTYVSGSTTLNGVHVADPGGGTGTQLLFNYPTTTLATGATNMQMLRYRVRIGVSTHQGVVINRAWAKAGGLSTTEADAKITITGGVFSNEAFVFGKVFLDCNRNGVQEPGELGIPGVRLFLEDGTGVVTDAEGKWSLYGLKPVTHALKLDKTTLPQGAQLEVLDSRNAGVADSRFVDLKNGEWHKANFAVQNCDNEAMMNEVKARRDAIAAKPDGEGMAALVRSALDPEGRVPAPGDIRALPASGSISTSSTQATPSAQDMALIKLPDNSLSTPLTAIQPQHGNLIDAARGAGPAWTNTPAAPSAVVPLSLPAPPELETLLPQMDKATGFINLHDGDVLPGASSLVRVKGPAGSQLKLFVNGEFVSDKRIGKRATLAERDLTAWEYFGVPLKTGKNQLHLEAQDEFGNVHTQADITVVAPGHLAKVVIEVPAEAHADAQAPIKVKIRLLDERGTLVAERTPMTLETDRGRWNVVDLNPMEPGVQTFMSGGETELEVIPPSEPGTGRLRVSAGQQMSEVQVVYLPAMRPMMGIGVVEGIINLSHGGAIPLGAQRASDQFESALTGLSRDSTTGDRGADARAAFYFKGTIKGEYLLTTSYDSDKTTRDRLFRDIRPDEFYPVYGDAAVKSFDAQSSGKLYVRIDNNRSYLLYGDFVTASSNEVRQLTQVSRAATGLQHKFDNGMVRATSFATRDTLTQQIQEFPANGTSGPYTLTASGDLMPGSELVEIVVRDRQQPSLVLSQTSLTSSVDYILDPLTKSVRFLRPISTYDMNLNPQSIRVTYSVDAGGTPFWVAGTDVQVKVGDHLQLGAVVSHDGNPAARRDLEGTTALARIGEHTTVAAEVARTRSDVANTTTLANDQSGGAGYRVEVRHEDQNLKAHAQLAHTSDGFDNPSSMITAGRTEAKADADYTISDTLHVKGQGIYSEDNQTGGKLEGVTVSLQKRLDNGVVAEVGVRSGNESTTSAATFDYGKVSSPAAGLGNTNPVGSIGTSTGTTPNQVTTVLGRVSSVVPGMPAAKVYAEAEQNVEQADEHLIGVGGEYQLTDKTRLYGRYELMDSLTSAYQLNADQQRNVAIFGVTTSYLSTGQIYNEYRLRDTIDGKSAQSAMGVRNTWSVNDRLKLTGGFEHVGAVAGGNLPTDITSTAVTGGFEYAASDRMRTSGTLELRQGSDQNSALSTLGMAYKLDPAWSLLARSIVTDTDPKTVGAMSKLLIREQIGMAYRPVNDDRWNALARYEYKDALIKGGTPIDPSTWTGNDSQVDEPGHTVTHVLSLSLNYEPEARTYVTGRWAAKWQHADYDGLAASNWAQMLYVRGTHDLNEIWDVGVQAGMLVGDGGSRQLGLGLEGGYRVANNLWASLGFNLLGFRDRDLTASDYTDRGFYVRLRYKFDENALPGAHK